MPSLDITGRLLRNAEARVTAASGEWALHIELAPPAGPKGRPRTYRACKVYGTGEAAALACKRRAQDLRTGARVRVQADAEDAVRSGLSQLHQVLWIETPDLQQPNYLPD